MVSYEDEKLVIIIETGDDPKQYHEELQMILLQLYRDYDFQTCIPDNHWIVPDFLIHLSRQVSRQTVSIEL